MSMTRFVIGNNTHWEALPIPMERLISNWSFWESRWLKKRMLVSRKEYYSLSGEPSDTFVFDGDVLGEFHIGHHSVMAYLWQ